MRSGVYLIINLVNEKIYVGSSRNLKIRKIMHFSQLRNNKHCNYYLQNAFNKYKENNFKFFILELCTINELFDRENFYIKLLKPEYNLCKKAGDPPASSSSKESIQKRVNKNRMNGSYERNSSRMKGNKFAKGQKRNDKEIERLHKAKKDKFIKKVVQMDLSNNVLNIFNDTVEAGKAMGVTYKNVWQAIKRNFIINKKFKVKYEEKIN